MNRNMKHKMRILELESGKPIAELIRLQVEQGKNWDDVAEALDISRITLQAWRKELGIRRVLRPTTVVDEAHPE